MKKYIITSLIIFLILLSCKKGKINTAWSTKIDNNKINSISTNTGKKLNKNKYPPINGIKPEIEKIIFNIVNEERTKRGIPKLKNSIEMTYIAELHCRNMIDQKFFSHTDHKGRSPFDRMKEYFPDINWKTAGENVAYNFGKTPQEAAENLMNAWMNSTGHRKNILNKNFQYIGVGVVENNGYFYSSQNFYADWNFN
jgi:uncharacterized protein YkwD